MIQITEQLNRKNIKRTTAPAGPLLNVCRLTAAWLEDDAV